MSEEAPNEPSSLEDRVVAAAKEQGWREGGELDAFEFVNRGSQFHRTLKREVDSLKEENGKYYKMTAEFINSQKQKEHEAEQQQVEQQMRQAASEGDQDAVVKLAQKLNTPPPEIADPNIEVIAKWQAENDWFTPSNPDMHADALGFYTAEMKKLKMDKENEDPSVILPLVRKRMEKEHPDYFKAKNPNREFPSGETGGKVRTTKKAGELTIDDLDEDEARHIKDFIKMGMDEKKLLKTIAETRKANAR